MRVWRRLLSAFALSCGLTEAAEPDRGTPLAWPAGPFETRVAFGKPVPPIAAQTLVGQTIAFDSTPKTAGADRDAPETSETTHKGSIRIVAVQRLDEGRTLVLAADPHPREAVYTLLIPRRKEWGELGGRAIRYDLSGVEVSWSEPREDAEPAWSGWWPVLDSKESRRVTADSVEHSKLWALLAKPGKLTLRTLLKLPPGKLALHVETTGTVQEALLGGEAAEAASDSPPGRFSVESTGEPIDLSLTITTGDSSPALSVRVGDSSGKAAREQPILPEQLTVTWAPPTPPRPSKAPTPPDLHGGDPVRGEAVFFGQEAKCSACHAFRGKGGTVGPELGEVYRRPLAEVYRDIAEPSASIHPEFVPYTVALKDGRVFAGVVRAEPPDKVKVVDTEAKATVVAKTEIEALRPSATSIMPVGLVGAVGEARMRDLLSFLMSRPAAGAKSGER